MLLSSITTTKGSDWRAKVKEIDELQLKKIALFLTCLNATQRKELYGLLEKTKLKKAPFCHIRSDMPIEELDYLSKKWQTKAFNLHTSKEYPFRYDYANSKYRKRIFIENVFFGFPEEEIKQFGGVCLDVSHLENDRLIRKDIYDKSRAVLEKYKIGCNHISGVFGGPEEVVENSGVIRYDKHYFTKLGDFDYLKQYPKKYFSKYCALEVENPLKDQLQAIVYIKQIINY